MSVLPESSELIATDELSLEPESSNENAIEPITEQTPLESALKSIKDHKTEILALKTHIKTLTATLAERSALSTTTTKLSHPTRARPSRRAVKAPIVDEPETVESEEQLAKDAESVKKRVAGGFNLFGGFSPGSVTLKKTASVTDDLSPVESANIVLDKMPGLSPAVMSKEAIVVDREVLREWVMEVTGVDCGEEWGAGLKDGSVLMKLVKALYEGRKEKINTGRFPFMV
jgi:hypothetical protein